MENLTDRFEDLRLDERDDRSEGSSRPSDDRSIGSDQGSTRGTVTPIIGAPPSYYSEGATPGTYTTHRIPSARSGRGSAGVTPYPRRISSRYTTPPVIRYQRRADVTTRSIPVYRSGQGLAGRSATSVTERYGEVLERSERPRRIGRQHPVATPGVTLTQEHYDYLMRWTRRGLDAEAYDLGFIRREERTRPRGPAQVYPAGPEEREVNPRQVEGRDTRRASYPEDYQPMEAEVSAGPIEEIFIPRDGEGPIEVEAPAGPVEREETPRQVEGRETRRASYPEEYQLVEAEVSAGPADGIFIPGMGKSRWRLSNRQGR